MTHTTTQPTRTTTSHQPDECGGYFYPEVNHGVNIFSPNYPNNYNVNDYCVWRFDSSMLGDYEALFIEFHSFETEYNDLVSLYDCQSDGSNWDDGSGCVLFYAMSGQPHSLPSWTIDIRYGTLPNGRNLKVVFKEDGIFFTNTGFNATVSVVSTTTTTTKAPRTTTRPVTRSTTWPVTTATQPPSRCGEPLRYLNLTYPSIHTIYSPNYPNRYDNHEHCVWEFISPPGTQIVLEFQDFRVSIYHLCMLNAITTK